MRLTTTARYMAPILLILLLLSSVNGILSISAQTGPLTREIQILADGTIVDSDPVTPLIQSGDTYTFSGDVYGRIDVLRNGVTLDGAGHSLIKSGEKDFAVMAGKMDSIGPRVSGVTLKNIYISGYHYGVSLYGSGDVVSNVTVTGGTDYNGVGIWVDGSSHTIKDCSVVANMGMGILVNANNTRIVNNLIADNGNCGIYFYDSAGTIRNNAINNNTAGPFHMEENELTHAGQPFRISSNDIDASNTVNGKPVCYWVNETGRTVPSDAGYVVLDRCKDIVVDGLYICKNPTIYSAYYTYSISLIRSSNIIIQNNRLENTGIWCSYSSQDLTLSHNTLIGGGVNSYASNVSILMSTFAFPNATAITLGGSYTTIAKNIMSGSEVGIHLSGSHSTITQNRIENCNTAISVFLASGNIITENNFLNNKQQVTEQHSDWTWPMTQYYQSLNLVWNRNYWSSYNGTDANRDGIGDTPYIIFENMTDYQPLITAFAIPNLPQGSAVSILPSSTSNVPTTSASATVAVVDTSLAASTIITVIVVAGLVGAVLVVLALRFLSKKKMQLTSGTQQVV
jgi:parallel beta-helix repeat protein